MKLMKLSILFMRFILAAMGRITAEQYLFQFSLWDSFAEVKPDDEADKRAFNSLYEILLGGGKGGLAYFTYTFNSLYEILGGVVARELDFNLPFNSLYEILDMDERLHSAVFILFQFSLWDSQGRRAAAVLLQMSDFQFSLWDSDLLWRGFCFWMGFFWLIFLTPVSYTHLTLPTN